MKYEKQAAGDVPPTLNGYNMVAVRHFGKGSEALCGNNTAKNNRFLTYFVVNHA
jgi:hypothetical protein